MTIYNNNNEVIFTRDILKDENIYFDTDDIKIGEHGLMIPLACLNDKVYDSVQSVVDEVGLKKGWLLMDGDKTGTIIEINLNGNNEYNIDLLVCCFPLILPKSKQKSVLSNLKTDEENEAMKKFFKESEKFDIETLDTVKLKIELSTEEKDYLLWHTLKSVSMNWFNMLVSEMKRTNDISNMPVILNA